GGTITGMPLPVNGSDVVNLDYIQGIVTGFSPRTFVRVGTTANLNATYANGSAGIGATLTNAGTLAALTIDGVTPGLGDGILVKDQTTQAQNGLYPLTTLGSGSVAWSLTRRTDYDQSTEVQQGTYTIVQSGTVNAGTVWVESSAGPFTIGITPI